jgi:hypothetical protein
VAEALLDADFFQFDHGAEAFGEFDHYACFAFATRIEKLALRCMPRIARSTVKARNNEVARGARG